MSSPSPGSRPMVGVDRLFHGFGVEDFSIPIKPVAGDQVDELQPVVGTQQQAGGGAVIFDGSIVVAAGIAVGIALPSVVDDAKGLKKLMASVTGSSRHGQKLSE